MISDDKINQKFLDFNNALNELVEKGLMLEEFDNSGQSVYKLAIHSKNPDDSKRFIKVMKEQKEYYEFAIARLRLQIHKTKRLIQELEKEKTKFDTDIFHSKLNCSKVGKPFKKVI